MAALRGEWVRADSSIVIIGAMDSARGAYLEAEAARKETFLPTFATAAMARKEAGKAWEEGGLGLGGGRVRQEGGPYRCEQLQ